jgi:arsenite methyltransferase
MTEYLNYNFKDDQAFIDTFDEMPLWSASFGLLLLKHIILKPNLMVLDIGSGAGFPLLELAARLGKTGKLFGIDPWANANNRARQKIKNYNLAHVDIIESSAETLPFDDNSIDLIVSNLGINNFENPELVFKECYRVLKLQGKLALTTNLNGHWQTFYTIFEETLLQLCKNDLVEKLKIHQLHRGSVATISQIFTDNGFNVVRHFEESFDMRFLDGSAFLNHYFIKLGWLSSWRDLLPQKDWVEIFSTLELNLNSYAQKIGELKLSVPMAFIEGEK